MKTRQIPRNQWAAFFDTFSPQHGGRRVGLEIFGPEIGNQIGGRALVLEGMTAELSDAGDKIEIMIGATSDDHFTHTIIRPSQVSLEQTDNGDALVLAVKNEEGTMTLLRFGATISRGVSPGIVL
jgi:Family of unknown function (DUF5335)